MHAEPLLEVRDLALSSAAGAPVLRGASFAMGQGEIVGVVGESGSGKSQLLLSLLGLQMPGARLTGSVRFRQRELVGMGEAELRSLRGGQLAMLFQDPLLSWNPCLTIGAQLLETARLHTAAGVAEARRLATESLRQMQLEDPEGCMRRYPHQLSGGMRQRALLVMAMLGQPALLLADEPTTALDATTQLHVLDQLRRLREQCGMSILLVTHDLGAIARVADRVLVLQAGRIVEQAATAQLLRAPVDPYTRALVNAARELEGLEALA